MQQDWIQFMASQGAQQDDTGASLHFSGTEFPDATQTTLCDLSGLAVLSLEGPDGLKLLQGQITHDTQLLTGNKSLIADHCTHKGRVIATLRVSQAKADHILLTLPSNNANALAESLGKYLAFYPKTNFNSDAKFHALAIHGPDAARHLTELNLPCPELGYSQWSNGTLIVATAPSSFEIYASAEFAKTLWTQLAPNCQLGGIRFWFAQQIECGMAWVLDQTRGEFTPHQLNHQLADAISFKKGCYTGQEVVARMHYKATLKNHAYRFQLKTDIDFPANGKVLRSDGAVAGTAIIAAKTHTEMWECLANIKDDALTGNGLYLEGETREKLIRMPLPYAIN